MATPRIDLNLLLVFEAVLATRSTTLAGSNLGLSQSGISNALNRLRASLDDPLFVRTPEGMMPTPRAQEISRPLLEALDGIRNTLGHHPPFEPETSNRTFRIYISDVGQMVMLPILLGSVHSLAPNVSIETVAPVPLSMREATMSNGEVDLAIGYFDEFTGPYHIQRLFEEHYICMVRAEHPKVVDALPLDLYVELQHALYAPRGGGHHLQELAIEKAFENAKRERNVKLRAAHFLGFTRIMAQSDLVSTLPSQLAKVCSTMIPVKLFETPMSIPSFDVSQLWHRRFHQDPGNRWLRRLVVSLFATHDRLGQPPGERALGVASQEDDRVLSLSDSIDVAHPLD